MAKLAQGSYASIPFFPSIVFPRKASRMYDGTCECLGTSHKVSYVGQGLSF